MALTTRDAVEIAIGSIEYVSNGYNTTELSAEQRSELKEAARVLC